MKDSTCHTNGILYDDHGILCSVLTFLVATDFPSCTHITIIYSKFYSMEPASIKPWEQYMTHRKKKWGRKDWDTLCFIT